MPAVTLVLVQLPRVYFYSSRTFFLHERLVSLGLRFVGYLILSAPARRRIMKILRRPDLLTPFGRAPCLESRKCSLLLSTLSFEAQSRLPPPLLSMGAIKPGLSPRNAFAFFPIFSRSCFKERSTPLV